MSGRRGGGLAFLRKFPHRLDKQGNRKLESSRHVTYPREEKLGTKFYFSWHCFQHTRPHARTYFFSLYFLSSFRFVDFF